MDTSLVVALRLALAFAIFLAEITSEQRSTILSGRSATIVDKDDHFRLSEP